jgi:1,4-dihydroxy-2-naphthoate polyprenyltransferase
VKNESSSRLPDLWNLHITKSTVLHLRIPFSFFLSPVYLFALSEIPAYNISDLILSFSILHLLVFPSSNGYNSYNDRDTSSIGLLKNPPQVTSDLYTVTLLMDILAVILSFIISFEFALLTTCFILMSRAYSNRRIRLKKQPFLSFLIVAFFQGAFVYIMSYIALSGLSIFQVMSLNGTLRAMLISSLFIGSIYPLTQIYQHRADRFDGVISLSYLLGYTGSFIFSLLLFVLAGVFMFLHFNQQNDLSSFTLFSLIMTPVVIFFIYWLIRVRNDKKQANFKNSMFMNFITSLCMNAFFLILIFER